LIKRYLSLKKWSSDTDNWFHPNSFLLRKQRDGSHASLFLRTREARFSCFIMLSTRIVRRLFM
jgi:hypothetical protein